MRSKLYSLYDIFPSMWDYCLVVVAVIKCVCVKFSILTAMFPIFPALLVSTNEIIYDFRPQFHSFRFLVFFFVRPFIATPWHDFALRSLLLHAFFFACFYANVCTAEHYKFIQQWGEVSWMSDKNQSSMSANNEKRCLEINTSQIMYTMAEMKRRRRKRQINFIGHWLNVNSICGKLLNGKLL